MISSRKSNSFIAAAVIRLMTTKLVFLLLLLFTLTIQDENTVAFTVVASDSTANDESQQQQQCDTNTSNNNNNNNININTTCIATTTKNKRAPPQILTKGSFQILDPSYFEDVTTISYDAILDEGGTTTTTTATATTIANIPDGEAIGLRYVQNLVSPTLASKLIDACDQRSGWTSSKQSSSDGSASTVQKAKRTSQSCPLIWPQVYLPMLHDPRLASVKEEITLAWHLTQRIGQFLNVREEYIEPFQLIKYGPGEFYKEHHDHGSYYGATTEQRPVTLLVFLSDLPPPPPSSSSSSLEGSGDNGGYTKFRALGGDEMHGPGISVVPRLGDGVLWNNEDENGQLLLDAIHEAIPPKNNNNNGADGDANPAVIKYAMNVWIANKKIQENLDVSAYRTI